MVGKLNDMVTAAVVVDSAPNTKPISEKDFAQIKPVDLKPKEQDVLAPKDEEQKEQEGRLEPGTMSESAVSNMTELRRGV